MKGLFVTLVVLFACATLAPVSAMGDTWGNPITGPGRFTVLSSFGNAAVLDNETKLVWEQSPSTTAVVWADASYYCDTLSAGNRKGWRLPTIQELASLVDQTMASPALPAGHPFSNVQSSLGSQYWSATTTADNATGAWALTFFGSGPVGTANKSITYNFWCVRGGQGVDPQ